MDGAKLSFIINGFLDEDVQNVYPLLSSRCPDDFINILSLKKDSDNIHGHVFHHLEATGF